MGHIVVLMYFLVGALWVPVGLIPQASLGVGRELGYAGGKPPLRQRAVVAAVVRSSRAVSAQPAPFAGHGGYG